MNNNQYLIPANTKRGKYILSIFRPVDLAVFLTGVSISFILLIAFPNTGSLIKIFSVFPGLICAGLVVPLPNYHNVMVCLGEIISFYSNNRNYKWRGWCATYESKLAEQRAKANSK